MPRSSRLDAPGVLHHVMGRGIERRKIFIDKRDRQDFITRLTALAEDSSMDIYAWALLPNHFHLLCKTRKRPLSSSMRKLLTGYAVNFNRRHKRHGHLFQNRYKSIVCQEDAYLLELARYVHLNLLRAGIDYLVNFSAWNFIRHSIFPSVLKNLTNSSSIRFSSSVSLKKDSDFAAKLEASSLNSGEIFKLRGFAPIGMLECWNNGFWKNGTVGELVLLHFVNLS